MVYDWPKSSVDIVIFPCSAKGKLDVRFAVIARLVSNAADGVSEEWITDCLCEGSLLPLNLHLIPPSDGKRYHRIQSALAAGHPSRGNGPLPTPSEPASELVTNWLAKVDVSQPDEGGASQTARERIVASRSSLHSATKLSPCLPPLLEVTSVHSSPRSLSLQPYLPRPPPLRLVSRDSSPSPKSTAKVRKLSSTAPKIVTMDVDAVNTSSASELGSHDDGPARDEFGRFLPKGATAANRARWTKIRSERADASAKSKAPKTKPSASTSKSKTSKGKAKAKAETSSTPKRRLTAIVASDVEEMDLDSDDGFDPMEDDVMDGEFAMDNPDNYDYRYGPPANDDDSEFQPNDASSATPTPSPPPVPEVGSDKPLSIKSHETSRSTSSSLSSAPAPAKEKEEGKVNKESVQAKHKNLPAPSRGGTTAKRPVSLTVVTTQVPSREPPKMLAPSVVTTKPPKTSPVELARAMVAANSKKLTPIATKRTAAHLSPNPRASASQSPLPSPASPPARPAPGLPEPSPRKMGVAETLLSLANPAPTPRLSPSYQPRPVSTSPQTATSLTALPSDADYFNHKHFTGRAHHDVDDSAFAHLMATRASGQSDIRSSLNAPDSSRGRPPVSIALPSRPPDRVAYSPTVRTPRKSNIERRNRSASVEPQERQTYGARRDDGCRRGDEPNRRHSEQYSRARSPPPRASQTFGGDRRPSQATYDLPNHQRRSSDPRSSPSRPSWSPNSRDRGWGHSGRSLPAVGRDPMDADCYRPPLDWDDDNPDADRQRQRIPVNRPVSPSAPKRLPDGLPARPQSTPLRRSETAIPVRSAMRPAVRPEMPRDPGSPVQKQMPAGERMVRSHLNALPSTKVPQRAFAPSDKGKENVKDKDKDEDKDKDKRSHELPPRPSQNLPAAPRPVQAPTSSTGYRVKTLRNSLHAASTFSFPQEQMGVEKARPPRWRPIAPKTPVPATSSTSPTGDPAPSSQVNRALNSGGSEPSSAAKRPASAVIPVPYERDPRKKSRPSAE